ALAEKRNESAKDAPKATSLEPPKASVATAKSPPPAHDERRLDDSRLALIKAATVLVVMGGKSAPGLLASSANGKCKIITAAKVLLDPELSFEAILGGGSPKKFSRNLMSLPKFEDGFGLFGGLHPGDQFNGPWFGFSRTVQVVFRPGDVKVEKCKAKPLWVDMETDLAVIETETVKDPPAAPSLAPADLKEMLPVFDFGFARSEGAGRSAEMPKGSSDTPPASSRSRSVGVVEGEVSGLRQDAKGGLKRAVVDAKLDETWVGSPLFDARGRFAGVCSNADPKTGRAVVVPATAAAALVAPRVVAFRVEVPPLEKAPEGRVAVRAKLVGAGAWKQVKLVYSQVRKGNPGDNLAEEKGAKQVELKLEGNDAAGSIEAEEIDRDRPLYCQATALHADGTLSTTCSRLMSMRLGGVRTEKELKELDVPTDSKFGAYGFIPFNFLPKPEISNLERIKKKMSLEIEPRPKAAKRADPGYSVCTGLGARFTFPESGVGPTLCGFGLFKSEAPKGKARDRERLAVFFIACASTEGNVHAAMSVTAESPKIAGLLRNEVMRTLLDAFKDGLGPIDGLEEFDFGRGLKGRTFVAHQTGGHDPEDAPSLRVACIAYDRTVHAILCARRRSKEPADGRTEDMFATFRHDRGGMEVPGNATVIRLPGSELSD
ncbi:MAG TPA: hypothetical protein VNC50_04375, partial [Planctomycetia bacterium]|nr:hypothetical protein [Planctomycetia bacterium]